jgi:signal peptidase I
LVQELHPQDERRESHADSSEPHADAAPSGHVEALTDSSPSTIADEAVPDAERGTWRLESDVAGAEVGLPAAEPADTSGVPIAPAFGASSTLHDVGDADQRLAADGRLMLVKDELVAWIKTLFSAAVYAVLIVTFGFQVARVEGQSMAPTLEDQDRLIVNKLAYRIGEPRRGDIVMLYYPLNPEKSFVKRVIAEEGDTVRIVDGRVYVNDVPLRDDYVAAQYRSHDDWGPQVIPEGYDFVMGDHRNNSSDSRHWGMVPKKYIIGKVQLRWWPMPTARVF